MYGAPSPTLQPLLHPHVCQVVTELLRPSHVRFPSTLVHWELLVWWLASAVYLLRFMMLGMRINGRYHNTSVLLTEQMNLQVSQRQLIMKI